MNSKSKTSSSNEWTPPEPFPTEVPRFAFDTALDAAMVYLDNNGYVVLSGVATDKEVETGISLAWDFIEGLGIRVNRNSPKSWGTQRWPDPFGKGIVAGDGVGQCQFLWFCRGLENVQNIFRRVWSVDDLITSFDGFCFHRPFEYNPEWKTTNAGWYHCDQNGISKPEKRCVQGFLNFFDCGLDDGGLVVVPESHKIFKDIFQARPHLSGKGDFTSFAKDETLWNGEIKANGLSPIKVCCKPGDFVLWDSRTIHCNSSARTSRPLPKLKTVLLPPRRLVAYICMTPADRLTEEVRALRVRAYQNGDTTSHWPEEVFTPPSRKNKGEREYVLVELNESQRALIPM